MRTHLARAVLLLGASPLLLMPACDGDFGPSEQVEATTYPVIGNWVLGRGVVMLNKHSDNKQFCSGVIINKHSVLTTARCLQSFLTNQINIDLQSRADPTHDQLEHLVSSAMIVRNPQDGTATVTCLNGGAAQGIACGGKYKRIITYRENPVASGDSDNDLALLYSDTYGYYGVDSPWLDPNSHYADIYMGDLTGGTNLDVTGYGWSQDGQPSFYPYRASLPLQQKTAGSLLLLASTNARPCAGDQGSPLTVPATGEVVGLHSYNDSSGTNGCANPGYVHGTRLRDKMGWIESIIGKCQTSYNSAGQPIKRCYLAADDAQECDGAQHSTPDTARWDGCRGTGCGVCSEKVTQYPRYFENHPLCGRNTTCDNSYGTCSVNCPAPTAVDQAKWGVGLKGTYRNYTDTTPVLTGKGFGRVDKTVNFNWGTGAPIQSMAPDKFTIAWRGWLKVPTTGTYTFQTYTDDGVTLDVNGVRRINSWITQAATNRTSISFSLSAGAVPIAMDYFDGGNGAVAQLKWKTPGSSSFVIIPAANLSPSGFEQQFR